MEPYKNLKHDDPGMKTKMMMQLIQQVQMDFERAIEGSGASYVNTRELSGGAKINRLFHERFAYEIVRQEYDEKEIRKEIAFAIRNIHGVRIGLFTPDRAFDMVCKDQISKLKGPMMKLVDLLTVELMSIGREITKKMKSYPGLKEETERTISNFISEKEVRCKDQIMMLIDYELAYMNTNHDDFIGFTNAMNGVKTAEKSAGQHLGNQVIRKGYMYITNLGIMKGGSKVCVRLC